MKLSDEIVLYLYRILQTAPMQYVAYSELYAHVRKSQGSVLENEFTGALRYLVGKRYIQEEAAYYRLISEGVEYAQNLINPPVDYPQKSFLEQVRGNEVQEKSYRTTIKSNQLAIIGIALTTFLSCIGLSLQFLINNTAEQKPQYQNPPTPTFSQPILMPVTVSTVTPQVFSTLTFCYKSELDINNQCTVSRTIFPSPVTDVCVSWTPSPLYKGSSFRRVWQNTTTGKSHQNESYDTYGCLYWSADTGLSVGQYQVDLYANNIFVQSGNFVIIVASSSAPIMMQISERQGVDATGAIIYKEIYFIDTDGDADYVTYRLISYTNIDPKDIKILNDDIKSGPDEQKTGAIVEAPWWCKQKYHNYTILLEARIVDNAKNQSEPFDLEFYCK